MKHILLAALALAILGLTGCSRGLPPELPNAETAVGADDLQKLAVPIDLGALLKQSRPELAQHCADLEKTIHQQETLWLQGKLVYTLMPDLRLPRAMPVFQEAKYDAARGFSVPSYVAAGAFDSAVAEHLARHGDVEAASKLVDSGDVATSKKIEAARLEKNVPVEWTRLVGLMQHHALILLASDNVDGARQLIAIHTQLREVLSPGAQRSPLGAALLGRGLGTLRQAGEAWMVKEREAPALQTRRVLAAFGTPPAWAPTLPAAADVERFFAAKGAARAAAVSAAAPVRILDLANLPLPHESLDAAIGFLDADGRLAELMLTYRPILDPQELTRPEQLANGIEDLWAGKKDDLTPACPRRVWTVVQGELELVLTPRHERLGAIARLSLSDKMRKPELAREFGNVDFDRSFEQNRRLLAPAKAGPTLKLSEKAVAGVTSPLGERVPNEVTVERDPKHDVVSRIGFEFDDDSKGFPVSVGTIAGELLTKAGRPQIIFGGDARSQIDFVWEDGKTKYSLRAPFVRSRPVTLDVTDCSAQGPVLRAMTAQAHDGDERSARLKAGKPLTRISRELDGVKLGMSADEFAKALPSAAHWVRRDIPGGVMAAFVGTPSGGDAVAREWFARFDSDQLREVRVRYTDVPGNKAGTFLKILEENKSRLGVPETGIAPNAWADLPKRGEPVRHTWLDDITLLMCEQDPFGLEVTLRDCPPEHPRGVPLPALAYLARGTASCSVGMSKDELLKLQPKAADKTYLVRPAAGEPYDAVIAWLENDRVVRVMARHKHAGQPMHSGVQASKLLLDRWSREAQSLGWPLRTDAASGSVQSLASHDDQTRFRIFWRDEASGVSVFSEWKDVR